MVENFVTAFTQERRVVQGVKHIASQSDAPEDQMKNQHLMSQINNL